MFHTSGPNNDHCVTFWFYTAGLGIGQLRVFQYDTSGETQLWQNQYTLSEQIIEIVFMQDIVPFSEFIGLGNISI